MNQVKIIADSTCDLSAELLRKYDIDIVPLYVTMGEDSLKDDGVSVTVKDLYAYTDTTGNIPKTSAASVTDYMEAFEPYIRDGRSIVYIGLSGELSSTQVNARSAAEEVGGEVYVIDSRSLSTGIGLLVLHAAEMAQAGADAASIRDSVERKVPLVRASFLIDTLNYLHMGGRCSTLQMLGAAVLKFKPMLELKEGRIVNTGKMRGSIDKALRQYVRHMLDNENIDTHRVFVTHSPMPDGVAQDIVKLVTEMNLFEEVLETDAGSVVGCHCGPGTLGVLFLVRDNESK